MANLAELLKAISEIANATKSANVWTQLKVFALEFGATSLLVVAFETHGETISVRPLYNDKLDIAALAAAMIEAPGDPALIRALVDTGPFALSDVADRQGSFVRLVESMAAGGEAFIVPVDDGRASGAVVFAGRQLNLTPMARAILLVAASTARTAAFGKQEGAGSVKRSNGLTDREAECLRWAAVGKTDPDTATILGISPRTVRFHITNAKTKLGVVTRIQAVAKTLQSMVG